MPSVALDQLSARPGAYILIIDIDAPLALPTATLAPGRYAYCGSAKGPGGIAARLRRHARADKSIHWHVDRLTLAGRIVDMIAVPGGDECALFDRVMATPGASVPIAGFGSSDCRRCPAHLAAVPNSYTG